MSVVILNGVLNQLGLVIQKYTGFKASLPLCRSSIYCFSSGSTSFALVRSLLLCAFQHSRNFFIWEMLVSQLVHLAIFVLQRLLLGQIDSLRLYMPSSLSFQSSSLLVWRSHLRRVSYRSLHIRISLF